MSGRRKKIILGAPMAALVLAGVLAAGCSWNRWARVEPGEYVVLHGGGAPDYAAGRGIRKLRIDREARLMALTMADGSEIVTSFMPRERRDWPSGCPSNVNSTRMEVLEIAEDPLTFGAATFSHPVLVRECPPNPVRIVLREDGAIGGGGSACPDREPCVSFEPRLTASPTPMPLVRSSEGHEPQSWQAGRGQRSSSHHRLQGMVLQ